MDFYKSLSEPKTTESKLVLDTGTLAYRLVGVNIGKWRWFRLHTYVHTSGSHYQHNVQPPNVMFSEGHFLKSKALLESARPSCCIAPGLCCWWCCEVEEVILTMPEPNCCRRPLLPPWLPPKAADGRLEDRMLCMLLLSRNGTLLLVFGIEPP